MYTRFGEHRSSRTVFDTGAGSQSGTVTGRAANGGTRLGVARRDEKGRRVGTPVTAKLLGDPEPDRLEKAEALRQLVLAKDKRFRTSEREA